MYYKKQNKKDSYNKLHNFFFKKWVNMKRERKNSSGISRSQICKG